MMLEPLNIWHWTVSAYAVLYGSFAIGSSMRFFIRAGTAKRTAVSKYNSRWAYIVDNWDIYLVRTVIVLLFFSVWVFHPGSLAKALEWLHVPDDIANWIPIVPGIGSAWLVGYSGDKAVDSVQFRIGQKWPGASRYFKGEVPAYTPFVTEAVALEAEMGGS